MAILQSVLLNKSYSYRSYDLIALSADSHRKTAFLCHSHKDESLAKGLQVVLKESGVDLYIDWQDNTMPDSPNSETANKIKAKIRSSNIFLYLATQNSRDSRWCPWEIGNADSSNKKILIIPTSSGNYIYGSEYLELYPRIDTATNQSLGNGYAVFEPRAEYGQWLPYADVLK